MAKKSFVLLGCLLLFSSISDVQMGMSQHSDHLYPVREMELSYRDNKATENNPLIICATCKKLVGKVIASIGKRVAKDDIDRRIDTICTKIKIPGCSTFVKKYKNKLVQALVSGDNENKVCVALKLCK